MQTEIAAHTEKVKALRESFRLALEDDKKLRQREAELKKQLESQLAAVGQSQATVSSTQVKVAAFEKEVRIWNFLNIFPLEVESRLHLSFLSPVCNACCLYLLTHQLAEYEAQVKARAATIAARVPGSQAAAEAAVALPTAELLRAALDTTLSDHRGVYYALPPKPMLAVLQDSAAPSSTGVAALALPSGGRGDGQMSVASSSPDAQWWKEDYNTPLLAFRSYRLNPFFRSQAKQKLSSRTFGHKIDVHKELCPFELSGACRDPKCGYQHERDYTCSNIELFKECSFGLRALFSFIMTINLVSHFRFHPLSILLT